jgi:hypothetical protein
MDSAAELARFRETFGRMSARDLDGHLRCFLCNKRRGVIPPEYMRAIREVTERRYLEIEEWRAEYKRGPKRAWEEGAAERRKRQDEEDDCIVIRQKTGKGGRLNVRVPRDLVEEAKRRAASPKVVD